MLDRRLGVGALLAKIDFQKAYQNIPVHLQDQMLLGMMWEGSLFVDSALPFGLRTASKIFTAVADAAKWIVRNVHNALFGQLLPRWCPFSNLWIVRTTTSSSVPLQQSMDCVLRVFAEVGLPVAPSKLEGPTTCITFIGVQIDSVSMTIRSQVSRVRVQKQTDKQTNKHTDRLL